MKKLLFYLVLGIFTCTNVRAEKKFMQYDEGSSVATNLSPNGKFVVGVDPTATMEHSSGFNLGSGFKSYVWNLETDEVKWITEADIDNLGKTGYFTDITDDQTICGYFKDENYKITFEEWEGEFYTYPVNVAAVWKDGKVTSLGIGDFDISTFNNFADGSYATSISNDGKTVVGFVAQENFAFSYPVMWKYDETTGKWNFQRCKYPAGAKGGQVMSVSADGSIAVGVIYYQNKSVAVYWKNGEYTIIEGRDEDIPYNEDFHFNAAYSVSPSGEYILFSFNELMPCVFFPNEDRYMKLGTYEEAYGLDIKAISDNGDVFGTYKYGSFFYGTSRRPFWWSINTLRNVGFDYYIYLYASELEIPYSFKYEDGESPSFVATSADGKVILGNNAYETWVLQTEGVINLIPQDVPNMSAKETDLHQVTLTWDEAYPFPMYSIKSYNIYCDGKLIGNVEAEVSNTAASTQQNFAHKDAKEGYHKYAVTSVYQKEYSEDTLESPRSEPIEVCVAANYDLPLFDDFDFGSLNINYWTVQNSEINWEPFFWGCGMYLGLYDSAALTATIIPEFNPYSTAAVSRPMDARELDNVYISFLKRHLYANSEDWDLTGDTLSVEVSTDRGDTWISVKDFPLDKDEPGIWKFESFDISEYVAHTLFQVRLHVHGKGLAATIWHFDLFKVGTVPEKEAPADLIGKASSEQVNLAWKNFLDAYELNYLVNPYVHTAFGSAIGNEGKPLVAVNSFDPSDLSLFNGKYLTSIRAFINHAELENGKDTHASVVVYENGKLICEQNIEDIEYNAYNIVILKEPLKIDASKELKIGLKVFDYDERQLPIFYYNTLNFVAGKSDLYSEDDGKTWKKLSDFYADIPDHEMDGYCCWDITGHVTDEPTVDPNMEYDTNLIVGYDVFRDGELLNEGFVYYVQPRYVDEDPVDNACYSVVAYYLDGSISESSVQYCVGELSVDNPESGRSSLRVYSDPASDLIHINGDFNCATIFNINGQAVLTTTEATLSVASLPTGIYFVKVENGDSVYTEKVMIKR